jgi:iron complex transport system substrate-binding protein
MNETMPHKLRLALLLLGLVVVLLLSAGLTACGDDGDGSGTGTAMGSDETSAETTTTVSDASRTVTHAMGETEVPANPQRLVVLDSPFLDAAVALGVMPVGSTEAAAGAGLSPYLLDRLDDDIEIVGLITEPNLEAVAAARPDLILGAKVRHEALYDELSQIAPTVFTESSGTNWRDGLKITADALGKSAEAEDLLADYDARANEIGEKVGASDMTASIVRFLPGETRLYGPNTFSGSVLTDVGFDLGDKGFDANPYSMAQISAEQIGMADADVIFATTYGGDRAATAFPQAEALWKALPAVSSGNQFDVEDREWMLGIGLIGANLILDDIEDLLG